MDNKYLNIENQSDQFFQKKKDFSIFFNENYQRLYYFAFKLMGERSAAEDVVQDVFAKLWNQKELFLTKQAAKSYVYATLRNACYNQLRHAKVETKHENDQSNENQYDDSKLDLIIRSEVFGQIHQAIETLPEGCKSVLKLAYFDALKNHEIAQKLGVSINTVKTQKARAIQLLRLRLSSSLFSLFLYLYSK